MELYDISQLTLFFKMLPRKLGFIIVMCTQTNIENIFILLRNVVLFPNWTALFELLNNFRLRNKKIV